MTFRLFRLCIASAALVALSGCAGYQIGTQSLYPADVRTVYVPMFESDSFRRNLGERLTEAVIKEIETTTPYKVVGNPGADSILTGRIVWDKKKTLVENRFDEPREAETSLLVEVSWIRRNGQCVQDHMNPAQPAVVSLNSAATLVPEAGQSIATAHQQAIQDIARQIVGLMESPWAASIPEQYWTPPEAIPAMPAPEPIPR